MVNVSQTAWKFLATSRSVSLIRKQYLENKYGLLAPIFARHTH